MGTAADGRRRVKAVTWHGKYDLRVEEVPQPSIRESTDAVIRVTASGICGSDLHLYGKAIPIGMRAGDILGHEPVGIVEAVGDEVTQVRPGDRVVVPFNVACGRCFMCRHGLHSQCETTQNRRWDKGGSLFGYTHLYGGIPGGQAEYLRVPMAHFGPLKVETDLPDHLLVLLADVLPTAWQAVDYADVPPGGTVAVWGLGPVGQMCTTIALHRGAARVLAVDPVPDRAALARRHGAEAVEPGPDGRAAAAIRNLTDGRGADAVIDAVGMEATGSRVDHALAAMRLKPDRLRALHDAMAGLRRGGTLSITGVYVGAFPLFPLGALFDKQIAVRMGQANVRRWTDDLVPLLLRDDDPLRARDLVTHVVPLGDAPAAYRRFRDKRDGAVKVVLVPGGRIPPGVRG